MATRRPPSARRASADAIWRKRGVGDAALDMGGGREGRVHQHHGRADADVEMIVDMRRIVAGDRRRGKQRAEQLGAGLGEFVENEPRAGELGEDGEQAGAGRGLQHEIGRA